MRLRTLGGLELEGVDFHRPKLLVLLCYLALEGPKERRFLAELFWRGAANPANGLAKALSLLRKIAPDVVDADTQWVRARVETDAQQLLSHLDAHELAEAVRHYTGPFLAAVQLDPWPVELEEWVFETRERLAERVQRALLRLGERAAASGAFREGAAYAERAMEVAGAAAVDVELLVRLHRLLVAGGSAASGQVAKAAQSYGVALVSAQADARAQLAAPSGRRGRIPSALTSFLGRSDELRRAGKLLREQACRLLTLTGAGGSGKTRLALELAGSFDRDDFHDGVVVVLLDAVTHVDDVPHAVAVALDVPLHDGADPYEQLRAHIGADDLLLVLDNLEQLTEAGPRLVDLLAGCPNLKLLTTSRERLQLVEEWVLPIGGLPLPPSTATDLDEARNSEAVQLFMQRAQQANGSFAPRGEDVPSVVRICHAVDGFPLAIELAAASTASLPCRDLAQEIEGSLDVLQSTARNRPDRHRSIRAVFEHSWHRLEGGEQAALRKLGVFQGGFDRDAAAAVAGLSVAHLAALTDKALIHASPGGRYDLHPLIRGYVRERLSALPAELSELRRRHAEYYIALLARHEPNLWRGRQALASEVLTDELENLRSAWPWVDWTDAHQPLASAVLALTHLCELRGGHSLALDVVGQALAALPFPRPEDPLRRPEDPLPSLLLALQGWTVMRLGDPHEGERLARRALELIPRTGGRLARIYALVTAGSCELTRGEYARAEGTYRTLLACARQEDDPRYVAPALCNLAAVQAALGDYPAAERLNREGLGMLQKLENHAQALSALAQLTGVLVRSGRACDAVPLLRDGVLLARAQGLPVSLAEALIELAEAHGALACWEEASQACREAMEIGGRSGLPHLVARGRMLAGRAARARHDAAAAEREYLTALEISWGLGDLPQVLSCLVHLAEVLAARGERACAGELVAVVQAHPASEQQARDRARQVSEAEGLPPPRESAPRRARDRWLAKLVEAHRSRATARLG